MQARLPTQQSKAEAGLGGRLAALVTQIEAEERQHFPMALPGLIEAAELLGEQRRVEGRTQTGGRE